ncbi:DJ-1/PfpI family protein [Nocardioidaceae bacterium]|nr:DJ-1/PfpI family protein [Nocardioidaceae bacterium]
MRVGLLVFEGCDAMDVVGPYEVLITANRLCERGGLDPLAEVLVVGEPVRAYGGLGLVPTTDVEDAGPLDVLIVPGAIDIEAASPDEALRRLAGSGTVLASVCTGAFFLRRTGLAGDAVLTTHWEDVGLLRETGAQVRDDVRWTDDGAVVSSGGISSGIAMALHLVERFGDRPLAEATARQIDYVWTEQR